MEASLLDDMAAAARAGSHYRFLPPSEKRAEGAAIVAMDSGFGMGCFCMELSISKSAAVGVMLSVGGDGVVSPLLSLPFWTAPIGRGGFTGKPIAGSHGCRLEEDDGASNLVLQRCVEVYVHAV
ncbi:hypothetical protein ACLOJK_016909 [Asimina triloba]